MDVRISGPSTNRALNTRVGHGRVDDLAGHREPTRHPGPAKVGQPCGHACTGQDAHPGMSVGEDSAVGRHEEVATECHLHAAGNRCPVYRSHNRRAQLGDLRDAVLGVQPFKIGGPIALRLLEIESGTEGRIRACQHDCTYRRIAIGVDQSGVQGADQPSTQRISCLGTVHRQHPDRVAVLEQDKLIQGNHDAGLENSLSPM
jgi:hypothetical protein